MSTLDLEPSFKLNSTFQLKSKDIKGSHYEMPLLGFGVYQTPLEVTEKCCLEAFAAGYRHVDSAVGYRNEAGVGAAMRASGLPRGRLFFTTKIPPGKNGYEEARKVIEESLQTSGLEYIDLMLLHAPFGGSEKRKGSWRALVEAVEKGQVRSIGVSNYGMHHLEELERHIAELEEERGGPGKGGVLSVAQYEVHPWCPRKDIARWCAERNVALEAYCPVVRGQRWGDETLVQLAEKYGKTQAQILIRWSLQKGYVPLPKSVTPSRIRENADVYDFNLTPEELDELEADKDEPVAWEPMQSPLDN